MQQDARQQLIERLRALAAIGQDDDRGWVQEIRDVVLEAAEAFSASSGSSAPENVDLAWLIDRLETYYDFTSTGRALTNCVEWQALKSLMASGSPRADQLKRAFEAGMGWTLSWDRPFKQADADRGFALFLRRPSVHPAASSETQEDRSATSRFPYTIRGTNGPDVVCRDVDDVIRQAEHLGAVCEAHWAEIVQLREALAACQSQAGGRERAAFEAGCHARPCGDDGWAFEAPSDSQARAAAEAYAAYEAQSSPSQSDETPPNLTEMLESALTLGVQYGLVEAQHEGVAKTRVWIVEQARRMAAEALATLPDVSARRCEAP